MNSSRIYFNHVCLLVRRLALYVEDKERLKKGADHSRLVALNNKHGNLHASFVLSIPKTSKSFLQPQNLKTLERCLNWVPLHIMSKWSQQHMTILRLCPWSNKTSFNHLYWEGKLYIKYFRTEGEDKPPIAQVEGQRELTSSGSPPPTPLHIRYRWWEASRKGKQRTTFWLFKIVLKIVCSMIIFSVYFYWYISESL